MPKLKIYKISRSHHSHKDGKKKGELNKEGEGWNVWIMLVWYKKTVTKWFVALRMKDNDRSRTGDNSRRTGKMNFGLSEVLR
jgi:hypothetical protein